MASWNKSLDSTSGMWNSFVLLFYFSVSFSFFFSFIGKPLIIFNKPPLSNKSCHSSHVTIFSCFTRLSCLQNPTSLLANVLREIALRPCAYLLPFTHIPWSSAGFVPILPYRDYVSISSHQHRTGPSAEPPSSKPSEGSHVSVDVSCGGRPLVHLCNVALLSQNHFLHFCFLFCFQAFSSPPQKYMYSLCTHWLHNSGRGLDSGWPYRILRVQSPGPANSSSPAFRTLGCVLFPDEALFPHKLFYCPLNTELACLAKSFNKAIFKPLLIYKSGVFFYSPVSNVEVSGEYKVLPT